MSNNDFIFCTLFDSHYLSRGLALYESLSRHCQEFHLYIFAFDEVTEKVLRKMTLRNATIISLKEFEDSELLKIKSSRTKREYCWTSTPSVILYVLERYNVSFCTYLDADLYFFNSPRAIFEEMGNNSILITEHRYTKKYDQTAVSGKYCVQYVTFRNNEQGLKVLRWWRNACLDWCYARVEDGKFGDQKYLDNWTTRFKGVHELQNPGGGTAPWNVQQYKTFVKKGEVFGREKTTGRIFPIVFFHFHYLRFFNDGTLTLGDYQLNNAVRHYIYYPYVRHLEKIKREIAEIDPSFDPHGALSRPAERYKGGLLLLKNLKKRLTGSYNIVSLKKVLE